MNEAKLCGKNEASKIMDLPERNETYKLQEYWDKRYTKENNFEWCKRYGDFKDLMHRHVRKSDRILMLGCGNSTLSEDMYSDGYRNIVNIDFSPVVIENMKRKCQDMVDMKWIVMDITDMTFAPNSFDVVIEKATLDALLVEDKDVWNPSDETRQTMDCVLSQVFILLMRQSVPSVPISMSPSPLEETYLTNFHNFDQSLTYKQIFGDKILVFTNKIVHIWISSQKPHVSKAWGYWGRLMPNPQD